MAKEQPPHPGIMSHLCSLTRCRMVILLRLGKMIITIGALMIKGVYAFQFLAKMRHITGVTDVGISTWSVSRNDKTAVWDYFSINGRPVCSILDISHLTDGDTIYLHHLPSDMWQCWFLLHQISATGNTMFQGNTFYRNTLVLVNHLLHCRIYRMEHHIKAQIMGKERYLPIQFWPQGFWCMDMQTGCTPQQPES